MVSEQIEAGLELQVEEKLGGRSLLAPLWLGGCSVIHLYGELETGLVRVVLKERSGREICRL